LFEQYNLFTDLYVKNSFPHNKHSRKTLGFLLFQQFLEQYLALLPSQCSKFSPQVLQTEIILFFGLFPVFPTWDKSLHFLQQNLLLIATLNGLVYSVLQYSHISFMV